MNTFRSLYEGVMKIEKGYDANDQGAPAYCGINRRYHPSWQGWPLLDKKQPKQGAFYPDLEPYVIKFYADFWKPVRVDEINSLPIAQLLVDMKTQHGAWAKVINAAEQEKSPFDAGLSNTFSTDTIRWINNNPKTAYKAIAAARLNYVTNLKLSNEADRKGIIDRAKHYVNLAAGYVGTNPAKSLLLIVAVTFLFTQLQKP